MRISAFVAAWRFWTIPAPGEPGSETWGDPEVLRRGCGATWLTGSQFLLGEPFVNQIWAEGLDDSGCPIVLPESVPTEAGTDVCPVIMVRPTGGRRAITPGRGSST